MALTIRQVGIAEAAALSSITQRTFYDTFHEHNSAEDMKNYLNEKCSIAQMQSELLVSSSAFFFIEENDTQLGYLKINWGEAQCELKDQNSMEIERIYILKNALGSGVGQELFNFALQQARQLKVDFVWLGVWEKNTRAIRFYEKNGFELFDKHTFMLGSDKQVDWMMRREMR